MDLHGSWALKPLPGRQFAQMGETEYAARLRQERRQERGRLGRSGADTFGCGPEARAPKRAPGLASARAPRLILGSGLRSGLRLRVPSS